jgi:hypothetical protein
MSDMHTELEQTMPLDMTGITLPTTRVRPIFFTRHFALVLIFSEKALRAKGFPISYVLATSDLPLSRGRSHAAAARGSGKVSAPCGQQAQAHAVPDTPQGTR